MIHFDLPGNIIHAISWTVIHSIWQASLIALVMSVILQHMPERLAVKRYQLALGSLLTVAIAGIITFFLYAFESPAGIFSGGKVFVVADSIASTTPVTGSFLDSIFNFLDRNGELVTRVWIIGVIIFGLKFAMGYTYVQYLNYRPSLVGNQKLEQRLLSLMTKMQVAGSVMIAETSKVAAPMVTGFFKPVILFPLGMVNNLSTEEVEIIIAHELAHILRNDWIVNLLQSIVEIIFYYHPAVWWISAHVREERENACDDLALRYGFNHIAYAKVLVKLKEMQLSHTPHLVMSIYHSKNTLMNRIKRLLGQPQNRNIMKEKIVALALIFTVAIAFAGTRINKEDLHFPFLQKQEKYVIDNDQIAITRSSPELIVLDTIPQRKERSAFTLKEGSGKSYHIESENGHIKKLEVDGEIIPPEKYDEYIENIPEGKYWDFSEDGRGIFKGFDMDSFPQGFFFDFNGDMMGEEWREKLEELTERIGEMDFSYLEDMDWDQWGDEMKFHKLELDSIIGNLQFNKQEHRQMMDDLRKQLEEMKLGQLHQWEGMDRLHGLENLGDMFEDFHFNFPEWETEVHPFNGNANDRIARELNEDGLIKIGENNEIELTGKQLKINGDKQPENIWQKYKRIFEESTGMILSKDSKVKFDIIGKESRKGFRRI